MKLIQILINAKDEASSVFDKVKSKAAALFALLATYVGIKAFEGLVEDAAGFEAAMDRVKAATGASADEMRGLESAVKEAAEAGFTNSETAAALENIAKAGVDAQEAVAGLPGTMNLAKAGDIELAQSAEYLTKIIAAMGEKFGEAGRYADVLALGANASNTSVTGLAQAMSYSAPAAKALNLSLEYTVGLLGKFADNGIDASRSGTALNSILSQFLDPASKFRNELALAGITTNNFEEALAQLAAAGPRGANAILAVGMEAGPALRGLLNTGIGALDDLVGRLKTAEGSAAATAKTLSDNLNGSLKSLSAAWQSVKDVLGAPVLPVLKQGVDELTQAFRNAIADGTIARFGESIATAMRTGIQFVREFISTVDLSAVGTRLQEFADRANETLTKVGEYATNAGNAVRLAYGVMSAGVNAVLTAIYGIGSVFAEVAASVMEGVAKLRDGLAAITFGGLSDSFKLAAEDARNAAQGFGDAAQAMRDKAASALQDTADAAEAARNGYLGLVGATNQAKDSTDVWALAVANAAAEIERAGKAQAEATEKTQQAAKAATDQAAAIRAAKESLAALRAEYDGAIADGNLQRAGELQEKINKALREMKGSAKEAAEAAAQVEAAFGRLGVSSTAALQKQAAAHLRDYETIKKAGTATAEDLSAAFRVAAEAAIAANKGIAPAWVEAEAAVRGYKIAVDGAGRATLEAVNSTGPALERMARGWHMNREAMQANMDAIDELNMRYTLSADYTERQIALLERQAAATEKAAEAKRKYWNVDKDGFTLDANGQRQQMSVPNGAYVFDAARNAGLSEADALALMDKYFKNGKPTGVNEKNGINGPSRDWFSIVNEAISEMLIEQARRNAQQTPQGGGGGSGSAPVPTGSSSPSGSSSGSSGGGSGISAGAGVQIILQPGVDFSNRGEAERLARFIAPALKELQRKNAI